MSCKIDKLKLAMNHTFSCVVRVRVSTNSHLDDFANGYGPFPCSLGTDGVKKTGVKSDVALL